MRKHLKIQLLHAHETEPLAASDSDTAWRAPSPQCAIRENNIRRPREYVYVYVAILSTLDWMLMLCWNCGVLKSCGRIRLVDSGDVVL